MSTTTTTEAQAARREAVKAVHETLATARETLGERRFTRLLDESGWLPEPDHSDCAEPHDQDLLDKAARLVHASHDQFSWQLCSEATCRALRDAVGT
jgi:hypothetical protein